MKKITSRLLTLVMAVLLLSALVLNTAALGQNVSIANDASAGAQSISNFSAGDNAGVFGLQLKKGKPPKSMGAVKTATPQKDTFTREEVEAMSSKERVKNYDKIRKSMASWK